MKARDLSLVSLEVALNRRFQLQLPLMHAAAAVLTTQLSLALLACSLALTIKLIGSKEWSTLKNMRSVAWFLEKHIFS